MSTGCSQSSQDALAAAPPRLSYEGLEAANWQALARYASAISTPGAPISRVQAAFVAELTASAVAYAAGQVRLAMNPAREDPVPLLDEVIGVLAAAIGEAAPSSRPLRPCGTHAAYKRHLAHGEVPCDECAEAGSTYHQRRKEARADSDAA